MPQEYIPKPRASNHIDRRRVVAQGPILQKRHRLLVSVLGLSVLLIAAIFVVGYIVIFVVPNRELAVRVGDVEYNRGDLVELIRIKQTSAQFTGETFNASSGVFETLQRIVENEIILQSAPSEGITVLDEEVDNQIESTMRPSDMLSAGKSEEQITRETEEKYLSYLNTIQIDEETHRALIKRTLLREKFRHYIGDSVPSVAEQVHLYRLVIPPASEIDIIMIKFQDAVKRATGPEDLRGAYFRIVREFSVDLPETVRRGGDLGWIAKGVLPEYEFQFFDLNPGELSQPMPDPERQGHLVFFMVAERAPAKELAPAVRDKLKTKALQDWVNDQRQKHDVYAVFNSEVYAWIIQQLKLTSTQPTPTPDPLQSILSGG